jgi:hypothetical protein
MKVVITGKLAPTDGVEGCNFVVSENSRFPNRYKVQLFSPYEEGSIVAEVDDISANGVGKWLIEHLNW